MSKMPDLPCLPGFNFDQNIGRTRFHRSQLFDRIHGDVYYLAEKPTADGGQYPALFAWGEVPPGPTWLALDRQRLKFYAYFQESLHDGREPYRVRLVDISFFLEDGTMKISEPAIDNSGLEQGVLVRRQRIPLPDPVKYRYFDILDLNIGKEPNIFSRVYKIYDCDNFTRSFLNRMGIPVSDPLNPPADPRNKRLKDEKGMHNFQKKPDTLGKFLRYDRKVLRFFGYWDDSESSYGYVHELEILYFLADDTMDIYEYYTPGDIGPPEKKALIKKLKIPKFFTKLEPLGSSEPITVLNVLGESTTRSYFIADSGYRECAPKDYYQENDLMIGAQIDVFGRKVVITDLDEFTKQYYRKKYGLDDFTPLERPESHSKKTKITKYIPPYNGWGTYEDSLSNCFSMVPKRPKVKTDKFFSYENQYNDERILRFGSKMISDIPGNLDRYFVIRVHLFDNTISIMEVGTKSQGTNLFQKRLKVPLPGQNLFSNEKPKHYKPHDFYVGATVNLYGFQFFIETADEYTFNYMEEFSDQFPKSDVKTIMKKIRVNLKPVYREFIGKYSPFKSENHPPILMFSCLREALYKYLEDCITEHEILTVARHYSLCDKIIKHPREHVRALVHTELTRMVWNELDRLEEDINEWDRERTGYLDRHQLYTILRSNRIPLSVELINLMLDRLHTNQDRKIDCKDLLNFVNIKVNPIPPVAPVNLRELYWTKDERPKNCEVIDWSKFLEDLDLERELKEQTTTDDNNQTTS